MNECEAFTESFFFLSISFVFRWLTLKPIHKIQLHKVVLSEKTRFFFFSGFIFDCNFIVFQKDDRYTYQRWSQQSKPPEHAKLLDSIQFRLFQDSRWAA